MPRRVVTILVFDHAMVKRQRLALGLSQEDLARKADALLRTYIRWEKGTSEPRDEALNKLAAALDMDPDDLYFPAAA